MLAHSKDYLDKMSGFLVAVDAEGRILFKNDAFDKLPESASLSPTGMIAAPTKNALLKACLHVVQTGKPETLELGEMGSGGPVKWYSCEIAPIGEGFRVGAIASGHEITSLKKIEQQLRRSHDLLLDTEGIASFGTWEWDTHQNTVTWSDGLYQIYGVTPETYQPGYEAFLEKVHPDDKERVREAMTNAVMRQVPFSHDERIYRPDGTLRYLHSWGQPYADEAGNMIRLVGVCQDLTEQRLAEQKAKNTSDILSALIEQAPDAIFVKDLDGRFLLVNSVFAKFVGKPAAEIIGSTAAEFLAPADVEKRLAQDREVLSAGVPQTYQVTFLPVGMEERHLMMHKSPLRNSQGQNIGIVGIVRDVTELVESKRELEQSLALLRATFDATADGICVMDKDARVVDYNKRFMMLWKVTDDFLKEKTYQEAVDFVENQLAHPEKCRKRLEEIFANPACETHDMLDLTDGRVYERITRPQRIGDEYIGRVLCYRDITARVRNEEQIHKYSQRLKLLADASRDFTVARLDRDSILKSVCQTLANHFQDFALIRIFRKGLQELETAAFYHSSSAVRQDFQRFPQTLNTVEAFSTQQVLKTGKATMVHGTTAEIRETISEAYRPLLEKYPVSSYVNAPMRIAGEIMGMISVVRYRTEEPYTIEDQEFICDLADRAAMALDNAELYAEARRAVQVREDFISVASHELKTPLTPLKMQLQLLRDFLHSAPFDESANHGPLLKMFDASDQQIVRLARLIEDMIDVSRITTGRLGLKQEACDLGEIVSQVAERFEEQFKNAGCKFVIEIEPQVTGRWDRMRIEQILNNLFSNAIKYGPGKPVEVSVTTKDGMAMFSIRDYGIGIAKKDQARIFERFERAVPVARFGGMGLGLFIARQIAEAHGGTLWLESAPSEGSTFHVELPAKERSVRPEEAERLKRKLTLVLSEERAYLNPELRLKDLADRVGVKSYRLTDLIQTDLKSNFHDLINQMRVEHAKTLLKGSEQTLNLAGIAAESGFNSKSVFNDVFKKITGMTPSQYRKGAAQEPSRAASQPPEAAPAPQD